MMNWKKNKRVLLVICISAVIIGPLIINILFKIQSPIGIMAAEWSSGDALTFYAMIISAILAICGISVTIASSKQELQESIRNNKLPFIIMDFLETKTKQRDFFSCDITEELSDLEITDYVESPLTEINFVIADNTIETKRYLSGHQRTVIENAGIRNVQASQGIVVTVYDMYVYVPLLLENAGNGAAVSMRIGLNRINSVDKRKYVKPIPLKVGQSIRISIFCENLRPNSPELGDYEFEVFYNDIYGNTYRQSDLVQLYFRYEDKFPRIRFETKQTQEMVKYSGE